MGAAASTSLSELELSTTLSLGRRMLLRNIVATSSAVSVE
jgi:hypothetical protein